MFAAADRFAFLVKEVKREAADLRAVSAVGAPAFKGLTGVALTAVADAKRAVNKEFNSGGFQRFSHLLDLPQSQFTSRDDLRKADGFQKHGFFRGADIALSGCMQLDRRQIAHQQSHVLNDQRINACVVSLMGEPYGLRQFLIGKDRIQCHIDTSVETVREGSKTLYFRHGVPGIGAGAEKRSADIDGISAVFEGFDADIASPAGSEKFESTGRCHGLLKNRPIGMDGP